MKTPTTIVATQADPKVERIHASWLGGTVDAAQWLASVADEVTVTTGTVVGGGRYAYVLLDEVHTCAFVAAGVAPVRVDAPTRVLVLAEGDLERAVAYFPALTDAWAASLSRCAAPTAA